MDHRDSLRLVTPRLLLRDFAWDDLAAIAALRADPAVAHFMDFAPESAAEAGDWLAGVIAHGRVRPRRAVNFALALAASDEAIGWIGIGPSGRYPSPGELGFGYMLRSECRGRGLMPEAVRAMLGYGFRELGGRRISAWCHAANRASARVLEKAGVQYERSFRQIEPQSGQLTDCLEYAITLATWMATGAEEPRGKLGERGHSQ